MSTLDRTVWAGDQILYEVRAPGGSAADLNASLSPHRNYGIVGYTHAGRHRPAAERDPHRVRGATRGSLPKKVVSAIGGA